jgi:HlyD family secretion protein
MMPQDINQVAVGQNATDREHVLNARTTQEVSGVVTRISAYVSKDQETAVTSARFGWPTA